MNLLVLCTSLLVEPATEIEFRELKDERHVEVVLTVSPKQRARFPNSRLAGQTTKLEFRDAKKHFFLATISRNNNKEQVGPPIFARYRLTEKRIHLLPKYPLLPGVQYRAVSLVGDVPRHRDFAVKQKARQKTRLPTVDAIFPSASQLPANCLKFYVHFSQPMREGKAIFEQIEIRDKAGNLIPDPWRRTELWTPDAKRLTLWIHPGRIKQGVNLREEFGPVLEPNRQYQLAITTRVQDETGQRLQREFIKKFETTPSIKTRPLPKSWKISSPTVGTRETLDVRFTRPLDRALLSKMIAVFRNEQPVPGHINIGKTEQSWQFIPDVAWINAGYSIRVDGQLEDIAGNTPVRVFDTDLEANAQEPPELTVVFEPSPN